jgi:thiamine biosynthesis lipoprotein
MTLYHKKQEIISRQIPLMGEKVEISILCDEDQWPENLLESAIAEMKRIEDLFTGNAASNPVKQINAGAGIKPVQVNKEVYDLISRCMHILEVTEDAFKIINYLKTQRRLLTYDAEQNLSATKINIPDLYRHVEFDRQLLTVYLNEKGLQLNLKNITKGYAKDRAKYLLKQNGVSSGIIQSASEVVTWGTGLTGWIKPLKTGNFYAENYAFSGFTARELCIVTSHVGDAQPVVERRKNVQLHAKKTSFGCGIQSITIMGASAAMAFTICPLLEAIGLSNSIELVNQMKEIEVVFIDNNNTVHTSKNIIKRKPGTLCVA